MINAKTLLCGLLGNPVAHSFSPLIHNRAFQARGLNFAYTAFQVEDLAGALKGVRALGMRGVSVTIPFKIEALQYLDRIEDQARAIGAINTIVNDEGELTGYNSDGTGAVRAFEAHNCSLDGKAVLLLGSGGVARAIGFSLLHRFKLKSLSVLGVIEEQVCQLRADLQEVAACPVEGNLRPIQGGEEYFRHAEVFINCSPIGMSPAVEATPVTESLLKPEMVVFDAVYNPLKTTLLKQAEKRGCTIIPGVEMFLYQAAVQFELWTGSAAPLDVMRAAIVESVGEPGKK